MSNLGHHGSPGRASVHTETSKAYAEKLALPPALWLDPDVRWLCGVHRAEGHDYLIRESYEELLWWLLMPSLLRIAGESAPSAASVEELSKSVAAALASAEAAGYRIDVLLGKGKPAAQPQETAPGPNQPRNPSPPPMRNPKEATAQTEEFGYPQFVVSSFPHVLWKGWKIPGIRPIINRVTSNLSQSPKPRRMTRGPVEGLHGPRKSMTKRKQWFIPRPGPFRGRGKELSGRGIRNALTPWILSSESFPISASSGIAPMATTKLWHAAWRGWATMKSW